MLRDFLITFNDFQRTSFYISVVHNHTLPDPPPTASNFVDTAEHDGRYSVGSQTCFFEAIVIHLPSPLSPKPCSEISMDLGVSAAARDLGSTSKNMGPISVLMKLPLTSKEMCSRDLPISSVCRHRRLPASQILAV